MAAQGDFSEYAVDRELDLWLGGQAVTPPATVYVGLSTYQSFHLSGDYLEPVGGGYARVAVPNDLAHWPAAAARRKGNGQVITFPAPTGDWGTVVAWFVADAAAAGNVIASGSLTTPLALPAGAAAPSFAAGALTFGK